MLMISPKRGRFKNIFMKYIFVSIYLNFVIYNDEVGVVVVYATATGTVL